MYPNLKNEILEILNSNLNQESKAQRIEEAMNSQLMMTIAEERTYKVSVHCPMCMSDMTARIEVGSCDAFSGNTFCKKCGRAFSIHGDRTSRVTRIVPLKEAACTGSEQLRLSGI